MMENSTEVKETSPQTTIGQEYIVESHCDDKLFCEKNLFFECLLCEAVETYSKLSTHLTSKDHRFKFLSKHFPSTAKLIENCDEGTIIKVLNCICEEISRNINKRESKTINYMDYENKRAEIVEGMLSKIEPYDENAEFVTKMNETLKADCNVALTCNFIKEEGEVQVEEEDKLVVQVEEEDKDVVQFEEGVKIVVQVEEEDKHVVKVEEEDKIVIQLEEGPNSSHLKEKEEDKHVQVEEGPNSSGHLKEEESKCSENDHLSVITVDSDDSVQNKEISCDNEGTMNNVEQEEDETNLISVISSKTLHERRLDALTSLYGERIKKAHRDLEVKYKPFLRFPSLHPQVDFDKEWKRFYLQHSYQASFQSHKTFNYLPFWDNYWTKRVEEMKAKELKRYDSNLKHQLCLSPEHNKRSANDLSDISDDELDLQSPLKRQRFEEYEPKQSSFHRPPSRSSRVFTDIDRMMIAYNLAYEHLQEGKQLKPQELMKLMKKLVDGQVGDESKPEMTNQRRSSIQSTNSMTNSYNYFTDNDFLTLHENYEGLSPPEKINFVSMLKTLEQGDKKRYETLMKKMNCRK